MPQDLVSDAVCPCQRPAGGGCWILGLARGSGLINVREAVDHCVVETRQLLKIFDQGDDLKKVVLEDQTGRSIPDGLEEYS